MNVKICEGEQVFAQKIHVSFTKFEQNDYEIHMSRNHKYSGDGHA